MQMPILPTKFFIPLPRANLVPRLRLRERLERSSDAKLILVSAPAGYGKSSLVSAWVHEVEIPAAWLTLDSADNDPVRFWNHFMAALHRIPSFEATRSGESLITGMDAELSSAPPPVIDTLVTTLARVTDPFVLVLDDLHTVTDTSILDALYDLLEKIPPGMPGLCLVVLTRIDPPWPLARLRVLDQITELRSGDLRFSQEETAAFLIERMGITLSTDELATLVERTEGWIAGLQMAALSMQGQHNPAKFLSEFSGTHRFVLDYLVEEVLNRQTPQTLDFLLRTSILERLNDDLCRAVTGRAAPDLLPALEKANLFLTALDEQRTWYRYHPLFADLLQKQLRTQHPALAPDLHRRASQWFEEAGYLRETVTHALETGDMAFAADQVSKHILDRIQHGEMVLAKQWLEALPEERVLSDPVLSVAQVWTTARYPTIDLAQEFLSRIEKLLDKNFPMNGGLDPDVQQWASSQIAVLQVVIARARGEPTQQQQTLAQEAFDRVSESGDYAARAALYLRLGYCHLDLGSDEQADRLFSLAFDLGFSSGNYYAAHAASYGRVVVARRHGQLHKAAAIIDHTLQTANRSDEQPALQGIAMTMSGTICYERNELDEADRRLAEGLQLVQMMDSPEILVKGHYALACLQYARGNLETVPNLSQIAAGGAPNLVRLAYALQARLHLLLYQHTAAQRFYDEALRWAASQTLEIRSLPVYDWEIIEKLVYARIMLQAYSDDPHVRAKSRLDEILALLETQSQSLEDLGWRGIQIELFAVQALVQQGLGRTEEALDALGKGLALAAPEGYIRTFVDEGEAMRKLLEKAARKETLQSYTQPLLSAFGEGPSRQTPSSGALLEPLSEREMEVLGWLNSHLSVPEIAAEIHLAPSTVRTHIQHIYDKLNVHGRMEALDEARQIGIL